ncbi:hypothetical protein BGZ83_001049 [Gryganskiella cystojenkinii]|nr:hypothetical protein BGZ83_001049 [Gryganskiella cystojenkinii]
MFSILLQPRFLHLQKTPHSPSSFSKHTNMTDFKTETNDPSSTASTSQGQDHTQEQHGSVTATAASSNVGNDQTHKVQDHHKDGHHVNQAHHTLTVDDALNQALGKAGNSELIMGSHHNATLL